MASALAQLPKESLLAASLQSDHPATCCARLAKCFDRRIDPLQLRSLLLGIINIVSLIIVVIIALSSLPRSFAAEQPSDIPAWLRAHVGEGEGQIAQVVLQRARALYLQKVSEGAVKNPCYFAMDATRPGGLGRRFYVICEADRSFRAIPVGSRQRSRFERHREFRKRNTVREELQQCDGFQADDRRGLCDGRGDHVFQRLLSQLSGKIRGFDRSFVQFDGEGDTANARQRAIGGHPAVLLREVCLRKDPDSPYANHDGYVPFGKLVDYAGGRSNGCTSWSASDAGQIIPMMKDKPTTLYIYPESHDIDAVAQAVKAGRSPSRAGLYWNASCLKEIGSPKFWPKETLEPILAQYKKDHPAPPPRPAPICKGQ